MTTAVARKKADRAVAQAKRAETALKAYRMKQAGSSLWDIAEECQVAETAVGGMINEQLREAALLLDEGTKRTLLALEVDRLDALQKSIWRLAMSGDLPAIDRALRIIQQRAKLLGLEDITVTNITNNTVVVAGTGPEYIEALKAYSRQPLAIEE